MSLNHLNDHDLRAMYAQQFSQDMAGSGISVEQALDVIDALWPRVEETTGTQGEERTFSAISSPLASLVACVMSGDPNIHFHTGAEGIAQTVQILAMCAAVAAKCSPGYRLAKILPGIEFENVVPLGATVDFSMKMRRSGRAQVWILNASCAGVQVLIDRKIILLNLGESVFSSRIN